MLYGKVLKNVIFFCNLLIFSCGSHTLHTQVDTFDVKESILFNKCEKPCWLGIMPGQTSVNEAKSLLKEHYGNKHIRMSNLYSFEWTSDGSDFSEGGRVGIFEDIVSDITIYVKKEALTVEETLQIPGEPNLVFVGIMGYDKPCLGSSLYYSKSAVKIALYPAKDGSVGIEKMQSVASLMFLSPQLAVQEPPTDSLIIDWNGFQDYCIQ